MEKITINFCQIIVNFFEIWKTMSYPSHSKPISEDFPFGTILSTELILFKFSFFFQVQRIKTYISERLNFRSKYFFDF